MNNACVMFHRSFISSVNYKLIVQWTCKMQSIGVQCTLNVKWSDYRCSSWSNFTNSDPAPAIHWTVTLCLFTACRPAAAYTQTHTQKHTYTYAHWLHVELSVRLCVCFSACLFCNYTYTHIGIWTRTLARLTAPILKAALLYLTRFSSTCLILSPLLPWELQFHGRLHETAFLLLM